MEIRESFSVQQMKVLVQTIITGTIFGISGTNFEIGKASNGWTSLRNENYELDTSIPHTLKVLVHHDRMLFYIDDKQVANLTDTTPKPEKLVCADTTARLK